MLRVRISEIKAHFSRYLKQVEEGETLLLCRRSRPIAEIRPLPKARQGPRPIGLFKGQFEVGDAFFEPLPDDLLDLFEGKS